MSLKLAAEKVRQAGRGPDTELVHFTPRELRSLQGLAAAAGGKLTRNPKTGLMEAGFLEQLLPTLIGGAVGLFTLNPMLGAAAGAATGAAQNPNDPLMGAVSGGLGGYGGAGLVGGLQGLGAAATPAAASAIQNPALGTAVSQGAGSQAAQLAAQQAGFGAEGLASLAEAAGGTAPSAMQTVGYGLRSAVQNPGSYVDALGGGMEAAKTAGMAAAPMLVPQAQEDEGEDDESKKQVPRYRYEAGATGGDFMPGAASTSERLWFRPSFQRYAEGGGIAAAAGGNTVGTSSEGMSGASKGAMDYLLGGTRGGIAAAVPSTPAQPQGQMDMVVTDRYIFNPNTGAFTPVPNMAAPTSSAGMGATDGVSEAHGSSIDLSGMDVGYGYGMYAGGGRVNMNEGGFVFPADVVSKLGNGSSSAGLELLAQRYGAQPIQGGGDGMSDSIPAVVDGRHRAAVARDEAYLGPEQVRRAGGAKKLYAVMERVRKQAHGTGKQQRPVDARKTLA